MSHTLFGNLFTSIRNGLSVRQCEEGGGLPVTRIETIWNSEIDPTRVGYAGLDLRGARGFLLEPGDILFSHINSPSHIGKVALFKGVPSKLVHGMNLLRLRCDTTRIVPEFAIRLIRSPSFKEKLGKYINKAVNQASVSIGNLKTISVQIPPLDEQRRIAAILDQADALRRKRREAIKVQSQLTSVLLKRLVDEAAREGGRAEALALLIHAYAENGLTDIA